MSVGISAAAAGVGGLPNLAATSQADRQHVSCKCNSQIAASGASAVAPPRVEAFTSKTSKAIPALGTITGSVNALWTFYTRGYNGGRPWRQQEQEGAQWRRNKRKRWAEVKVIFDEIQFMACARRIAHEQAAALLEQERLEGKHKMPSSLYEESGAWSGSALEGGS